MQRLELAGIRRSALAALVIAFLIPVAVAVWALSQLGSSSRTSTVVAGSGSGASTGATTHPVTSASHTASQASLLRSITAVNGSMFAQGMMPPSACRAMSSTIVTCTQPVQAVNTVTFRTYP